ncbi:hypothetical protein F5I97DRAFT_1859630 [Phlebopus sp. FC_14]|nr:hypothetical protein F5I97DRAFT_1859630 [Phlebopus sp. FC_14]
MYIPSFSSALQRREMLSAGPLDKSQFTLDTSGVAGVFGGDEAVSAMATVHVYENRKWLGWYNTPGSYEIAKRYGRLAKSKFFDGFFPGVHTDPATLFELDGWVGPKFRAAHSGTIIGETGHLAALFMKECADRRGIDVKGRKTQPVGVTIAELRHVPDNEMFPQRIRAYSPVFASLPISVSIGTCVACAVFEDWYAFALILLGILVSGISCLVIGSGKFTFTHPKPAKGSPPGDGILGSTGEIVVLKGDEGAVNSITRGKFSLRFSSEPHYRNIGWCSVLLTIQFVAQLLLIPQASLFGQIMFVGSLVVSWAYNSWLSSLDKEKIQREILLHSVLAKPRLTKYVLGTRTSMVIFVLLALNPEEPSKLLEDLLPNDTKVWRAWKSTILRRLGDKEKFHFDASDWDDDKFSQEEKSLLETLYGDAQAAYDGYVQYSAS